MFDSTRNVVIALLVGLVGASCGDDNNNSLDAGGDAAPDPDAAIDAAIDAATDATPTDAMQSFGLIAIFPGAASRTVTTTLTIDGYGINGTPTIQLVNCDQPSTTFSLVATSSTSTSITTSLIADVTRAQGLYTVNVTNGDGMMASLPCALRILAAGPPTVTLVVPTTAYQGVATDNINSDVTVSIEGTGFQSTPNVRWVSTTNPAMFYEAVFVGFISSTAITAVAPSESLMMPAGTYHVFVSNPDTLSGQWLNGATPGIFTVTATPPPDITDVDPSRVQNGGGCATTTITFTGTGFGAGATAWYIAPTGTTCAGSTTDTNGLLLCPLVVSTLTATSIATRFPACPALGIYPVTVINPDGQADYFYSIEVTPSSAGHLNTGAFETQQNQLVTARWKHAVQFGFDSFSHAIVYVAGGQNAAGAVLGSVESSIFDIFGTPGPFERSQQYGSATMPRIANDLVTPREGLTLQRVGKSLFAIGGTTVRSDVATPVVGSEVVERAQILSYAEMPGAKKPTVVGTTGLPLGSWYYRVSALGPWGESLATREVVAINKSGSIEVCWIAPQTMGATSYNIYRSLAADGRAGTSAALAYEVNPATLCFTDNGAGTNTPAPGSARGTVAAGGTQVAGNYTYRVSAVVPLGASTFETYAGYATTTTISATDVTNAMQTVQVAWDALAITGVTYRVYRLDPSTGIYKLLTGAGALTTTSFSDGGVTFDVSSATPRAEVRPLPTGSLSKWTSMNVPQLTTRREGLDGVVIAMDPATSGNLVARILVAGGRDGTGGTYTYHKTAESLGIFLDGTTETAWSAETPIFTNARAYYALLTTQDRNDTPFPPPPDQPPGGGGGGGGGVIFSSSGPGTAQDTTFSFADLFVADERAPTKVIANVVGTEPVYVVAVMGDDAFAATMNQGRNDFESCVVNQVTGRLACGATWTVQTQNTPVATFGADAVLYFSYLYPFYGIARETLGGMTTAIQFVGSAISRFPLLDLTMITNGQIFGLFESASTSFQVKRAYFQMTRLLAYIYVVGGWAEAHTVNGITVPEGPTGEVERHQQ